MPEKIQLVEHPPNNWGQHMKLQGFLLDETHEVFLIYVSVVCIHSWLLVLVHIGSRAAFPAETLLACLSDHRNQLKIVNFFRSTHPFS